LTKRERAVVVLRYFEDLSEAQIALELEIAVGTVKSTLFRALGKLRVSPDLVPAGVTEMEIAG
jgi:RNA polymerase sigma factor (sigma-70 family)